MDSLNYFGGRNSCLTLILTLMKLLYRVCATIIISIKCPLRRHPVERIQRNKSEICLSLCRSSVGGILDSSQSPRRNRPSRALDHRCLFSYTHNMRYSYYPLAMDPCKKWRTFITAHSDAGGRSLITLFHGNRIHGRSARNSVILSYTNLGINLSPDFSWRRNYHATHNRNGHRRSWHVNYFWVRNAVSHPAKYR